MSVLLKLNQKYFRPSSVRLAPSVSDIERALELTSVGRQEGNGSGKGSGSSGLHLGGLMGPQTDVSMARWSSRESAVGGWH